MPGQQGSRKREGRDRLGRSVSVAVAVVVVGLAWLLVDFNSGEG
jgi:hypothetical protein